MPDAPPTVSARSARTLTVAERIIKILVVAVGVMALVAAVVFATALYAVKDQAGSAPVNAVRRIAEEVVSPDLVFEGRSRVNILLIGEDVTLTNQRQKAKEYSRSDTSIMIGLDRLAGTVHVMSIPRDTKVDVPGHGVHKLNASYRFGGPYLLMETIRDNFGLSTDHYIKTNFGGFVELVNLVDGIDVMVERDMDYDDSWQDFHVHLKKGLHHLSGEKAHEYVRWRKNNHGGGDPLGDLGRNARQQKVIKILAKKALQPQYLPRLRSMVKVMRKYVDTDLNERQLLSLLIFFSKMDPDAVDTATLPSEWYTPFMITQRKEALPLLTRMFGYTFDETRFVVGEGGRGSRLETEPAAPAVELRDPHTSKIRELEKDAVSNTWDSPKDPFDAEEHEAQPQEADKPAKPAKGDKGDKSSQAKSKAAAPVGQVDPADDDQPQPAEPPKKSGKAKGKASEKPRPKPEPAPAEVPADQQF